MGGTSRLLHDCPVCQAMRDEPGEWHWHYDDGGFPLIAEYDPEGWDERWEAEHEAFERWRAEQGDSNVGRPRSSATKRAIFVYRRDQLREPGREPPDRDALANEIHQLAQQALQTLNTSERQQRWRARIAQLEADGEKLSGPIWTALLLFRDALTEPVEDDALIPLLIAAYVGEMRLQQKRAESDPALSEELEETFTQMLERLERGEPPLV
jgi:hypothetical protein